MPTSGAIIKTESGELSTSGKPVRVFNVSFVGSVAGILQLFRGTAKSGNPVISLDGVANRSTVQSFENGLLFPTGCYLDFQKISAACVECALEL